MRFKDTHTPKISDPLWQENEDL